MLNNNFKKFKKTPLFLSLLVLTLSSVLFWFLYTSIQKNIIESGEMEAKWQNEAKRRDELKSLDRLLSNMEGDIANIESHFIKSSDVVPFLNLIEQLAPEVGAEAEVSLVDVAKDGSTLSVGINARGTFEALYKFLTLLENSPYELEFLSVNFATGGIATEGKPSIWSAVFRIKLLSFIP